MMGRSVLAKGMLTPTIIILSFGLIWEDGVEHTGSPMFRFPKVQ